MSETMGSSQHETNDPTAKVREAADTIAGKARQTAETTWTNAKERFSDLKLLERYIKENPIRGAFFAFALGFILALFLRK
jgi:ElaB/YqjD/DUF883 family membrane-anchored ribosome-binding protein